MTNVQAAFEDALDKIASYRREPSRWEEDCLARALAAMTCSAYLAAAGELQFFREESGPVVDQGLEVSRIARRRPLTVAQLREGLANLRTMM